MAHAKTFPLVSIMFHIAIDGCFGIKIEVPRAATLIIADGTNDDGGQDAGRGKRLSVAPLARDGLQELAGSLQRLIVTMRGECLADLTAKIAWVASADFTGSPEDGLLPGLWAFPYS